MRNDSERGHATRGANASTPILDFILKEWLLVASGIGLAATSIYVGRPPEYTWGDAEVLSVLFALFVSVNGIHRGGLARRAASSLVSGGAVPVKLVLATFFASMLLTNDIALLLVVPITMSLGLRRKGLLVVLEALAANAGSAATPIGNPQNLFIYWSYALSPWEFFRAIAPFPLFFLPLLALAAAACGGTVDGAGESDAVSAGEDGSAENAAVSKAWIHAAFLALIAASLLHLVPAAATLGAVAFAALFDRKALRVDYALLFTFLFFFGFAENLKAMVPAVDALGPRRVFLLSALASHVMSNVPAALLFAKFTDNWKALLWGVNAGGFGGLLGSFANIIAYKIYVSRSKKNDVPSFTIKFLVMCYAAFALAVLLYFAMFDLDAP